MGIAGQELARTEVAADGIETEVRSLVRGLNQTGVAEPSSDLAILKMSAGAIAEIDRLMDELQAARNYLHVEGERVRRMTARYEHLTKTALTSVRVISERISEWRSGEGVAPGAEESGRAAAAVEPKAVPQLVTTD
jgi:hypothetical protein